MKSLTYIILTSLSLTAILSYAETKSQLGDPADVALVQLVSGGTVEFHWRINRAQSPAISSLKSQYPSVPDSFWNEYEELRSKQFFTNTLETIRANLTPEQFEELRKFATSPTGQSVINNLHPIELEIRETHLSHKALEKRTEELEALLVRRKYKDAVTRRHCLNNQMNILGALQHYAMEKNIKDYDQITFDMITPYLKNTNVLVCPDGGKYTYNSKSQKINCSVPDHKHYRRKR